MKKYKIAGPLNDLKSGTTFVAVDLERVNSQVAGFDSDADLVDLIYRISNDNIFQETFSKRLKGSLGDTLAGIVEEIEKICKENGINLDQCLEMRKRFASFTSQSKKQTTRT